MDGGVEDYMKLLARHDESSRLLHLRRAPDATDPDAVRRHQAALHDRREIEAALAAMRVPAAAWDKHIGELLARHDAGDAELAALLARRRELALRASDGDAEAGAAVAAVIEQHAELLVAQTRLLVQIEQAGERRRAAAARERSEADEAGAQAQRRTEAARIGGELLATDHEIDAALSRLVAGLVVRRGIVRKLSSLGYQTNRMQSREIVCRALRAAGMGDFVDLPPVLSKHAIPLAAQDLVMLPVRPTPPAASAPQAAAAKSGKAA